MPNYTYFLKAAPLAALLLSIMQVFYLYKENISITTALSAAKETAVIEREKYIALINNIDAERTAALLANNKLKKELSDIEDFKNLINDDRIEKLLQKKPYLLINRINKSTGRMRKKFEDI